MCSNKVINIISIIKLIFQSSASAACLTLAEIIFPSMDSSCGIFLQTIGQFSDLSLSAGP